MSDQSLESADSLTRNTNRVVGFVFISSLLAAIFSTITYFIRAESINSVVLTWIVVGVAGIAFTLSRRGKSTLAIRLVLGVIGFAIVTSPLRNSGTGFVLGIFIVLLTVTLAPQTMELMQATQTIGVSIVIGLLTILLDWYWPGERSKSSAVGLVILYIFGGGLLALNGYFLSKQIQRYSLRAKLTLAFLMVATLSVAIVGIVTNLVVRTELTREVGGNIETLAGTVAQQVGNTLNAQLEVLQVIATRFDRIAESASLQYSGTPEEIQRELLNVDAAWRTASGTDPIILNIVNNSTSSLLRDFRRTIPAHAEIFLTDNHGALIAATNRTTDFYQADEDWWQAAYHDGEGGVYISQPVYDESAEIFTLEFAVPIFANGRLVGILRTSYEANVLAQILQGVELGGSGHAAIRISDDLLFGLAETELQVISSEMRAELNKISQEYGEIIWDGENVLARQVALRLPDTGDPHSQAIVNLAWAIVVVQNSDEAFAPVESATRTITLVSFGILLGTGLLAYYISLSFSTPILKLTAVAEEVRAGNLGAQAEVTSDDEIGTLATTFNSVTAQVRALIGTLEQRVADRTRALATSTEVSRRLSTILDQDELVRQVVEQVQQAFNYYHVHIYLWDAKQENLVMAGGTGEAGRIMLASGHSIPAERGLVGRAAESGTVVLVSDVSQTIGWLPNPLLPDTQAEIAVPILLGDDVLGVLDVQQNLVNGLSQSDADLLQSIANQVAIALQNARVFEAAQKEAQWETQMSDIVQKIQNTTSIEDAMKVAVREIGRVVNASQAVVRLKAENGDNGHSAES